MLVALILVLGLSGLRAVRDRGRTDAPASCDPPATPPRARPSNQVEPSSMLSEDEADLEQMFAAVDSEVLEDLLGLLEVRLRGVMLRGVPVRVIRASPAPSVARICFSDGTTVLATTKRPGEMVPMAFAMLKTSVTLEAFEHTQDGPSLRFGWRPGGTLEVLAVGLDQAD